MSNNEAIYEDRILRFPEVIRLTGISKSTILRAMERNKFPKYRRLSQASVGWLASDVFKWIKNQ
jgi:prophage regulatory protein